MSYEEKDYFMRQIKKLAEGLSMMLTLNSVKEIINLEQNENSKLTDEEIEAILLAIQVQNKADQLGLNKERLAEKTGLSQERLEQLLEKNQLPTKHEQSELENFLF
ncbi:hypothetical protein LI951_11780 [Enterococcus sp. BWT-B8]|uniref:hypothetical protein n=1 Tax=Enterococcus sp. BWT-B8 TaxID=2885157 RepID=UPI001E28CB03|nr:hypothetical protein [Enterococcus sp. BWT-B8]MCB5952749.1 hypothetical protein [Enterococcus sp. BWT-B8]